MVVLLSACGGGGGGYSPTCVDNGRGCKPHIPTDDRGDSSNRTPSDDRGELPHTPEDDRGDKSGYVPKEDTGGRPSRRVSGLRYVDEINIEDIKEYDSLGKELGLSYSNFGTYKIDKINVVGEQNNISENIPFIDVNVANRIDTSNIATNVKFTGRAVGQASSNSAKVSLDGEATLRFDSASGISSLGATFGNWYDINVQDNATGTIVFSNYKNKEDLVKFGTQPDANGDIIMSGANMDVNYYAPKPENGIPTEANGLLQFQEHESGIKLDVAFGAK